jgi:site-specific recombinase XerD
LLNTPDGLINTFIDSRRQGLSPRTLEFYRDRLSKAKSIIRVGVRSQDIKHLFDGLKCSNGGKHAYWRALTVFYHWLYSTKSGLGLNPHDNPMLLIDTPKVEKRILPSLTQEQVCYLIQQVECVRDKAIISLFADSGLRLNELASIRACDIDWGEHTVTIWGKGNKQRKAPFTERTAIILRDWLPNNGHSPNIWGIKRRGIQTVLKRLSQNTGIKCNPHSFRGGFACNLHRKGLSTLDIMHLGGWQDLSMVLRYTRSITFEDCLLHYQKALSS